MKLSFLLLSFIFWENTTANIILPGYSQTDTPLVVRHCNDFGISGTGENIEWGKAKWILLNQIDKGTKKHETKFKILYSATGLYVLFSGQDEKISSTFDKDYDLLYQGDVFEVFFHPDPAQPLYFEYEVSPLNKELVLLVSKKNGKSTRWIPWGNVEKKIMKKVNIRGGEMKFGSQIQEWTAELFFPFEILAPMMNVPPVKGMRWNANFCRLDYDSGEMIKWSWSPIRVSFHEVEKFFALQFE